ncbi:MAG: methyltransferase domain-containing protein [Rhodospirillales bacterium]|nr:methyltransferase domain-containing protein [Rhodospirillales bacterium]
MARQAAYGETGRPSFVDRFGFWLSARRIRALVGDAAGKRIADVGCGYHAHMARPFLEACEHLVLVDLKLAPEVKSHLKVMAIEGRLPDALAGLDLASLDVILCNSVLEHLSEPQETLNALRRLLKPGGVLYLNVPNWRGKWFLEFSACRLGFSSAEEIDDHKAYYDPEDLWPMLISAGFRPNDIVCYRHKFGLNTFAECRAEAAPTP